MPPTSSRSSRNRRDCPLGCGGSFYFLCSSVENARNNFARHLRTCSKNLRNIKVRGILQATQIANERFDALAPQEQVQEPVGQEIEILQEVAAEDIAFPCGDDDDEEKSVSSSSHDSVFLGGPGSSGRHGEEESGLPLPPPPGANSNPTVIKITATSLAQTLRRIDRQDGSDDDITSSGSSHAGGDSAGGHTSWAAIEDEEEQSRAEHQEDVTLPLPIDIVLAERLQAQANQEQVQVPQGDEIGASEDGAEDVSTVGQHQLTNLDIAQSKGPVSPRIEALAKQDPHIGTLLRERYEENSFDIGKTDSKTIKSMLRLIDYCDQTNGNSRSFLDGLLQIIGEEMSMNGFSPKIAPSRKSVVKQMTAKYSPGPPPVLGFFRCSGVGNPYQITDADQLACRRRDVMNCVAFHVREGILDMLGDRGIFGNTNNLVVNQDNPFAPYTPVDGGDEILDGSWRANTKKRLENDLEDPFNAHLEFLLDLIIYYDKTGTSDNQRYPLEPFIFSLAIIKRALRNNPRAWRPLGFMPDLESKSSADQTYSRQKNKVVTPQTYHRFLDFILEGVQKVQDEGIVTWLRLGNRVKRVVLRVNVAFIIQDGKSADMTTLRRGGTFAGVKRISRSCNIPQALADAVNPNCGYWTLEDVAPAQAVVDKTIEEVMESAECNPQPPHSPLSEQEKHEKATGIVAAAKQKLEDLGFHPIENAFLARCIRFGLDPRNIWGACPTDLMHAFQSGILMYMTKMVLDKLTPKPKKELDELVEHILGGLRSSEKRDYPRYSFTKGFCKVSNISSDEWVGKLFVLYLVSLTTRGKEILGSRFAKKDLELPRGFHNLGSQAQANKLSGMADDFLRKEENKNKKKKRKRNAPPEGQDTINEADSVDSGGKKKNKEDDSEDVLRKCSFFDFRMLCEALLCFHAWYRLDSGTGLILPQYPNARAGERCDKLTDATSKMMALLKYYLPRKAGLGWKIQKVHDIFHVPLDVDRYGSPKNYDAGPLESALRFWAKYPALTAQTRGYNEFVSQVANRLHEYHVMAKARRENGILGVRDKRLPQLDLNGHRVLTDAERNLQFGGMPSFQGSSLFRVYLTGTRPTERITEGREKTKGHVALHRVVENFIKKKKAEDVYFPDQARHTVEGETFDCWYVRTECSTPLADDHTGRRFAFRCHPNYRSQGPWYDWAMVRFSDYEQKNHRKKRRKPQINEGKPLYDDDCVPVKVLGWLWKDQSLQSPPPQPMGSMLTPFQHVQDNIVAIVHACHFQNERDWESSGCLAETYRLDYTNATNNKNEPVALPVISTVSLDSIVDRCFVVEEFPGVHESVNTTAPATKKCYSTVHLIRKRAHWGTNFV